MNTDAGFSTSTSIFWVFQLAFEYSKTKSIVPNSQGQRIPQTVLVFLRHENGAKKKEDDFLSHPLIIRIKRLKINSLV